MTVELVEIRKVAVFSWDTTIVQGDQASIEAEDEEKRVVKNDGQSNVFFPQTFTGDVEITVKGSHDGEDSGTISVV
jgi:hypothetical protein